MGPNLTDSFDMAESPMRGKTASSLWENPQAVSSFTEAERLFMNSRWLAPEDVQKLSQIIQLEWLLQRAFDQQSSSSAKATTP